MKERAERAEISWDRARRAESDARKASEKAERIRELNAATQAAFKGLSLKDAPLPTAAVDTGYDATLAAGEKYLRFVGRGHVVYVVWPLGDVFVKIGVTRGILGRVAGIQTGNPRRLVLVAAFYEGELGWTERRLHMRFHELREVGEWFRLEGELAAWLAPAIAESKMRTGPAISPAVPFYGREV